MLTFRLECADRSPWQPHGEILSQTKHLVVPALRIDQLDIEVRPLRELRSHKLSHEPDIDVRLRRRALSRTHCGATPTYRGRPRLKVATSPASSRQAYSSFAPATPIQSLLAVRMR
jgi:hypothetical protein